MGTRCAWVKSLFEMRRMALERTESSGPTAASRHIIKQRWRGNYRGSGCMLAEQELSVKGRDGVVITRAKERTANCQQCCSRTFIIYDGSEQELYRLKAGQCTSDSGNCNACAPSCCVNAYEVDMYLAGDEGKKIDTSAFLFPGCCTCAGATDRSNFVVKFPAEATTHQRAALLGGMFLVEYTIMELKRQQELAKIARDNQLDGQHR